MMTEQIFAQAAMLAGELDEKELELLRMLCGASAAALAARLKDGVTVESCREAFVPAACLYALAAMDSVDGGNVQMEEFKAGDLSIKQGSGAKEAASLALNHQAEALMAPYLKDCFCFAGV